MITEELLEVRKKFANPRRTQIKADEGEFDVQDLIAEEDVVITVCRAGYVKRQPIENVPAAGRGGRGVRGANLKEEDVVNDVFTTTTHHWLLFFTTQGQGLPREGRTRCPSRDGPRAGSTPRTCPGVAIDGDERVSAVIDLKEYAEGRYLLFATRKGMVKKTTLPEYDSPRTGLAAINLKRRATS